MSTIAAFGNTRGQAVDESYRMPGRLVHVRIRGTKVEAHRVAEDRIAHGAPIVIVQPGGLYGPGDHSAVGAQIEQATRGKLPALAFPK